MTQGLLSQTTDTERIRAVATKLASTGRIKSANRFIRATMAEKPKLVSDDASKFKRGDVLARVAAAVGSEGM